MPSHLLRRSFWIAGLSAGVAFGQTSPIEAPASLKPPQEQATTAPKATRNASADLHAALSAGFKFDDPAAAKKKKEEEETDPDVDLRDVDKPRNAIVRLPKFVVQGERPPVFAEKDINTKKGLADLAVKRYLSSVGQALNKYHLPLIGMSQEQLALMMYEEDQRLKDMKDFGEKVYLYRQAGDKTGADALQKDIDRTFMRTSTFADPPK
ncbi:hypothetical protein DB347_00580 [Opitutaceae bacterium EW11]|nr:hypothetical protein DB347_00580 [Opitutaceae bacterium EW11]